jgi:hypothetical protein
LSWRRQRDLGEMPLVKNKRNVYDNPLAAKRGGVPHEPTLVFSFPVFVPLARRREQPE